MIPEVRSIEPGSIPVKELHGILLGTIVPRPIAFASTQDAQGNVNLSPFSFFNVFSAHPPILVFSPARRVRDNTTKHTLDNVLATHEVVINTVHYDMVEQMSLSSGEYEKGVNEFIKSGFTEVDSVKVAPPRVKESLASFECKVNQVIPLGDEGGAGNLIICEVVMLHINEDLFDASQNIDPIKTKAVARMGGNWYNQVNSASIFSLEKPTQQPGIGFDRLPEHAIRSTILTGNDLGRLASIDRLPSGQQVEEVWNRLDEVSSLYASKVRQDLVVEDVHQLCKNYLDRNQVEEALALLVGFKE